jgi:type IV pilus assembly protein PilV
MKKILSGFSLIEVMISMAIFSIGVLGVMGMQARSISYFSDSKNRTDAALLADGLINDIWVNRANIALYNYTGGAAPAVLAPWVAEVQKTLPAASATVAVNGSQVQVTVFWQPPDSGTQHQHIEIATIQSP